MKHFDLQAITEELVRCMRCGNCQAVCPIYKEIRREVGAARGKIRLIQGLIQGEAGTSPEMAKSLDLCLTCGACQPACPCGVDFGRLLAAARAHLVRRRGLGTVKSMAFRGLRSPRLTRLTLGLGRRAQRFWPKTFPTGLGRSRTIPPLAPKTLLEQAGGWHRRAPAFGGGRPGGWRSTQEPAPRVAYFAGCSINYLFPETGLAVIEVLLANAVEVLVPKDQHCCGTPVRVSGEVELAREMAVSTIQTLASEAVDAVITSCSTCGESLRRSFIELTEGTEQAAAARKLASKTYDISEFLVDIIHFRPSRGRIDASVTYHDPCHLNRGLGVSRQPREILRSIPGVRLIEMSGADRCCGGAGTFTLSHPGLSEAIGDKKGAAIAATGADRVVSACPACRIQLEEILRWSGRWAPVRHVVELLAKSYRLEKRSEAEEIAQ